MTNNLEKFYADSKNLIYVFDTFVQKHKLSGRALADHICYKCESSEEFESIRKLFELESIYVHQAIISGRRIAYIKLKQGITSSLGEISFLELSDQKPDNSQTSGFEHIEIYAVGRTYDEMVSEFEKTEEVKKIERPHHSTHDIKVPGFIIRCTHEPLAIKIARDEMT